MAGARGRPPRGGWGGGAPPPTITDAMTVCGWLGHSEMAYGQLHIDVGLARAAVGRIATRIGRSVEETAQAILDVAVSEMFVEVEKLASRSGVDLREFTLMPLGGGGPMLGAFLAREFRMAKVIAPLQPGVVSALGGLVADLRGDFVRTVFIRLAEDTLTVVRDACDALVREGRAWLSAQGHEGSVQLRLSADMRYLGQSFEIEVAVEPDWIRDGDLAAMEAAFHAAHERLYDFADPDGRVELVNLRLSAIGEGPAVELPVGAGNSNAVAAPERFIPVYTDGRMQEIGLFRRDTLRAGERFRGPAVVAQDDTTFAIPAGADVRVDRHLNLHLTFAEQGE